MYTPNIRLKKKCDLCAFIRGMVVGARCAGLRTLSTETADLLEFPHQAVKAG